MPEERTDRTTAVANALLQIEKQFGKGSIMQLGKDSLAGHGGRYVETLERLQERPHVLEGLNRRRIDDDVDLAAVAAVLEAVPGVAFAELDLLDADDVVACE